MALFKYNPVADASARFNTEHTGHSALPCFDARVATSRLCYTDNQGSHGGGKGHRVQSSGQGCVANDKGGNSAVCLILGCEDNEAREDGRAGDSTGCSQSNPNSSEGGRPEDGLRFSKDHLQQRWKGNHISELVRWEALASAEDVDR